MCVLGGGGNVPLKRAEFSPFATGRDGRRFPGTVYHDELHRMPTPERLDNLLGGGVGFLATLSLAGFELSRVCCCLVVVVV